MTPQQKADNLKSKFGELAPAVCKELINICPSVEIDWWLEVYLILTNK